MDNFESNCINLRVLLGFYLSKIKILVSIWYYDITLPQCEPSSFSLLFFLIFDQLKLIN